MRPTAASFAGSMCMRSFASASSTRTCTTRPNTQLPALGVPIGANRRTSIVSHSKWIGLSASAGAAIRAHARGVSPA